FAVVVQTVVADLERRRRRKRVALDRVGRVGRIARVDCVLAQSEIAAGFEHVVHDAVAVVVDPVAAFVARLPRLVGQPPFGAFADFDVAEAGSLLIDRRPRQTLFLRRTAGRQVGFRAQRLAVVRRRVDALAARAGRVIALAVREAFGTDRRTDHAAFAVARVVARVRHGRAIRPRIDQIAAGRRQYRRRLVGRRLHGAHRRAVELRRLHVDARARAGGGALIGQVTGRADRIADHTTE